jgi:hypothetical protein
MALGDQLDSPKRVCYHRGQLGFHGSTPSRSEAVRFRSIRRAGKSSTFRQLQPHKSDGLSSATSGMAVHWWSGQLQSLTAIHSVAQSVPSGTRAYVTHCRRKSESAPRLQVVFPRSPLTVVTHKLSAIQEPLCEYLFAIWAGTRSKAHVPGRQLHRLLYGSRQEISFFSHGED